jgi:hypothetical protein
MKHLLRGHSSEQADECHSTINPADLRPDTVRSQQLANRPMGADDA